MKPDAGRYGERDISRDCRARDFDQFVGEGAGLQRVRRKGLRESRVKGQKLLLRNGLLKGGKI